MSEGKSQRWAFTAYEQDWECYKVMPEIVAEWGWQEEICPKTQRPHYQGYMRLKRQVRLAQLKKIFPTTHFEIARDWNALVQYCKKTETAVEGTQHHDVGTKYISMSEALIRVAINRSDIDYSSCQTTEDFKRRYIYEYDEAVGKLLRGDPDLIGLYSQPQYERAYCKWRSVWVEKAEERLAKEQSEKTDRQTDTAGVLENLQEDDNIYDRN